MAKYILNQNKQDSPSGENYEIHNEEICTHLPIPVNRIHIGYFNNCKDAMASAIKKYPELRSEIDGCYWCCNSCHKE